MAKRYDKDTEKCTIKITKKLYKKINDYCSVNEFNFEEINNFIEKCLERGFMVELYGVRPQINKAIAVQKENNENIEQAGNKEKPIKTIVVETVDSNVSKETELEDINTKNVNLEKNEEKIKTKRRKLT